jgi:hypothetical protein
MSVPPNQKRTGVGQNSSTASERAISQVEVAMRHYPKLFRATLPALFVVVAIGATIASPFTDGYEAWQRGDYAKATSLYREGAEQGDANAQFALGNLYLWDKGVPHDDVEAAKWISRAAEQGHADSQSLLGALYIKGRGVTRDVAKAAKWYRKAAEQGVAEAQRYLGSMYETVWGAQE